MNSLKLEMASGMTSMSAIDRKRVPAKVIARSMICLFLKQLRLEMKLPKMVTSRKNATMSTSFRMKVASIII